LNKLAALVRQELPQVKSKSNYYDLYNHVCFFIIQLVRDVCRALITIDVHARDIVSEMVQIKVC